MRSLSFKETANGLRSGSFASNSETWIDTVLPERRCQGHSKDSFAQNLGRPARFFAGIGEVDTKGHLRLGRRF